MAQTRPSGYNYKTLVCNNIPELFLDKYVARNHFARFGTLVNVVLRPKRMSCTISYSSEAEAAQAMREGNVYNGHAFDICYADSESTAAQKTEECVDPDVQAELSALSAGWGADFNAAGNKSGWLASNNNNTSTNSATAKVSTFKTAERNRSLSVKLELEALLRRPAHTTEEKYRVLDARDKLMRLQMRRTTDIKTVTTTKGYCPDMCPEKERLLREFQRQVAIFELLPNTDQAIAHNLAIKQYSRSSADQETPLPHELRSEDTLHMTMAYLMHEVMNSNYSETHVGDWFHFLWDRTRSIRKEITQQELCSLGSVKLVEQCARFHIHCTARLVAEDPSIFDSKINAENLTKCLQTLKYMYHDLRLKGVQCPRESEFRGYIVLLNLADANFLWDIGQLPVELQSCKEIRHAIKFYLALQDTNFVRFFQLLRERETTYLSACILVTYFTQLRVLAMRRIIQSYRGPRKMEISSIPLKHVTQMLSCCTDQIAREFLEYYGIEVNESNRVLLSRIETPETEYKLRRQYKLVEAKRNESIGECICGEEMPSKLIYKNHRPHNSFNGQGYLNSNAWTAKDQMQSNEQPVEAAKTPSPETLDEPKPARKSPTDTLFKVPLAAVASSTKTKSPTLQLTPSLFTSKPPAFPSKPIFDVNVMKPIEPIFGGASSSSTFGGSFTKTPSSFGGTFSGNIFQVATQQPGKSSIFAQPTDDDAKAAEAAAKAQAKADAEAAAAKAKDDEAAAAKVEAAARAKVMAVAAELQRQQAADKAAKEAAKEAELAAMKRALLVAKQQEEEQMRKRAKEHERLMQATLNEQSKQLLLNSLDGEIRRICMREKTIQQDSLVVYDQLINNQIINQVTEEFNKANSELNLMRHYWSKWRNYVLAQQLRKQLFDQLPLSFGSDASSNLLGNHHTMTALQMMRRYRQGEPCNYNNLLAGMARHAERKLNIWHLLKQRLLKTGYMPGARRYCKLLLLLPENTQVEQALKQGMLQRPLDDAQSSDINAHPAFIYGMADDVAICVRKLVGPNLLNERNEQATAADLLDADGIILYLDNSRCADAQRALNRLRSFDCIRQTVIIPLDNLPSITNTIDILQLENLKIFGCQSSEKPNRDHSIAVLYCAVQYLAEIPNPSRYMLLQAELREWLIMHSGTELFNRLRYAARQDASIAYHCRQSPQFCVDLYNEALRRLQKVLSDNMEQFSELAAELRVFVEPLPAGAARPNRLEYFELDWKNDYKRSRILYTLERAMLPQMPPKPASTSSMLAEQRHAEICEWLLGYAQISQDEPLVELLAMQTAQALAQDLQKPAIEFNYLNIVEIFAKERLQHVLRSAEQLPATVVYNRLSMSKHFDSQWYYEWQPAEPLPKLLSPIATNTPTSTPLSYAECMLNFNAVVSHAEDVLKKRRAAKRMLVEQNSSSVNDSKRQCPMPARHETPAHPDDTENIANATSSSTQRVSHASQSQNATPYRQFSWETFQKRI